MRVRQITARELTTGHELVELNGERRAAYRVCEVQRAGEKVTLRVRRPDGIAPRVFDATERVEVRRG